MKRQPPDQLAPCRLRRLYAICLVASLVVVCSTPKAFAQSSDPGFERILNILENLMKNGLTNVTVSLLPASGTVRSPIIDGFKIFASVPFQDRVSIVTLTMDDTDIEGGDTKIRLFAGTAPACAQPVVRPSIFSTKTWSMEFPLPLWVIGNNNVAVEILFASGKRLKTEANYRYVRGNHEAEFQSFTGDPRGSGYQLRSIPATLRECHLTLCKDADEDGLIDLWENIVLHDLHPYFALDQEDELLVRPGDRFRVISRVTPVKIPDRWVEYIMLKHSLVFSRDYGATFVIGGIDSHKGDTEKVIQVWARVGDFLWLEEVITKGHLQVSFIPEVTWLEADVDHVTFGPAHRIEIAIEEDKHGAWPSTARCNARSSYDCYPSQHSYRRPPAINAGEPPEGIPEPLAALGHRGRPFLDRFDGVNPTGPHASLLAPLTGEAPVTGSVFPGERVWQTTGDFCGGLGSSDCDGASPIGRFLGELYGDYVHPSVVGASARIILGPHCRFP